METGGPEKKGGWAGFKTVPPRVKKLIYLTSFSSIAYGYILIAITAYLPEVGLAGHVGLLIGVNGLVFVLTAIPLGIASDRWGRKTIFLLGMVGIPPSILVFAFTTELVPLLIATAVAGMCEGGFASTWNALIADQTVNENRTQAFSLSFIVGNASFGIGMALPFVFPAIQAWTGLSSEDVHNYAYIAMTALAAVSPVLLWPLLRDYKEVMRPRKDLIGRDSAKVLLKFSGINSLIGLGAGFIIPLIALWLYLKFGVTDAWSGPLLAVSNITIGFAAIVSSRLARDLGMIKAIVLTQFVSTVFMLSLAFVPGAVLAASLYLVRAALMNMAVPLLDSFMMGLVRKEERGTASAINSIIWRLPNSATTIVGGYILVERGDYELPFYIAAAFYAAGITMFYFVFKDVKLRTDAEQEGP